jgi:hypothetical protein
MTRPLRIEYSGGRTTSPRAAISARQSTLDKGFTCADDIPSAVVTAYRTGRFTMRPTADHLGVHYSTVSRLLARIELRDCKT